MRIIVAGGGAVGEQVASELTSRSNHVTVVERDSLRAAQLEAKDGIELVRGDACSPDVLEAAGGLSADVLVACTGRDEDNLVISTLAKRHLEIPRVVARVNDVADRWLFDDRSGVDSAISSAIALVALIEEATGSAGTVRVADLPLVGLILLEGYVGFSSAARGRSATDLSAAGEDIVASVIRHGRPLPVRDDLLLQAGDRVLVLTGSDGESRITALFG